MPETIPSKTVPVGVATCPECNGRLHLIFAAVDPGSAAEIVSGKISATCFNRRCPQTYDPLVWRDVVFEIRKITK